MFVQMFGRFLIISGGFGACFYFHDSSELKNLMFKALSKSNVGVLYDTLSLIELI